ncbi:MAG: hypothetical protein CM1200mP40_24000 [Gammaproteobacteria bacterium]|nr:MAG: hypothetical protein CM1200mP40_24000 [Gammaproteobacteria bacterium]
MLTEPHAGTDLGIINSKAIPNAEGSYDVTGTKIFITAGDHDLTGNIIHLVLANPPGAPAGPRGISLFPGSKVFLGNGDGSVLGMTTVLLQVRLKTRWELKHQRLVC